MAITAQDILAVMLENGIPAARVAAMDPAKPILAQDFDSVDLPMIATAAEEKFGVDLSDATATELRTINDFVALINKLKG